uniref:Uncharacterized protein n=1 Tax=Candidatus Kentrum sp. MB TaxID=2138164 RepID=A0A450XWQ0_9GAMM|nr:MAG: hypothetical protein BECKMB1821G_GA0114241_104924 [Candidatus Kentron sp. MB]VFK33695.1 MAG: hypothetical protein BECKMB1821I_GA0114274_105124 [Candidatus Kentron sp. MB]VFK76308.1 MAG: hypothetical protein BECKMB1821H_GA0114242_105024 [Candidatus Kentron sp. MB]
MNVREAAHIVPVRQRKRVGPIFHGLESLRERHASQAIPLFVSGSAHGNRRESGIGKGRCSNRGRAMLASRKGDVGIKERRCPVRGSPFPGSHIDVLRYRLCGFLFPVPIWPRQTLCGKYSYLLGMGIFFSNLVAAMDCPMKSSGEFGRKRPKSGKGRCGRQNERVK